MALASFGAYRAALNAPGATATVFKDLSAQALDAAFTGTWHRAGNPVAGTTPSTAAALDYTGALGQHSIPHPAVASGRLCLVSSNLGVGGTSEPLRNAPGAMLIDRLSHQGGLVGNITTAQNNVSGANLPTAALTRYTDGVGVMIALQIYTALGATDSIVNISYTNEAGTPGRTASVWFVATPSVNTVYIATLQAGDLGVRSVEAVQLVLSTGTAGNMGITLFKPLAIIHGGRALANTDIVGWNSAIESEAHLELLVATDTTGTVGATLQFAEV